MAPSSTAPLARLSAFTLLAHGDFSTSLATVREPLAVAELPHRKIFFLTDPALVAEATLSRALRDRQDAESGGGGIVSACGKDWARRRDTLRGPLQSRDGLEAIAAPAVAHAVASCGCPADALLLPPEKMLPACSRLVRHALRRIVIATDDAEGAGEPSAAAVGSSADLRVSRRGERPVGAQAPLSAALRAPFIWLFANALRLAVSLGLLTEHAASLWHRRPFFDTAELFTSRKRKVERRVAAWRGWARHEGVKDVFALHIPRRVLRAGLRRGAITPTCAIGQMHADHRALVLKPLQERWVRVAMVGSAAVTARLLA